MSIDARLERLLREGRLGRALAFIKQAENERKLTIEEKVLHAELLADLTSSIWLSLLTRLA
jgi:hypothetical protein